MIMVSIDAMRDNEIMVAGFLYGVIQKQLPELDPTLAIELAHTAAILALVDEIHNYAKPTEVISGDISK